MDRISKVILTAVAVGLFANASAILFKPTPAAAQNNTAFELQQIEYDLGMISEGGCANKKIC